MFQRSWQLHNHLLTEHQVGEPIKCQILNSDGVKCGMIFINTRSFTEHQYVYQEKYVECNLCNHLFATEEKRAAHVKRHHISGTQEKEFQYDECGSIFETSNQLANHKTVHKLKKHRELLAQKAAERKAAKEVHTASQMDVQEALSTGVAEGGSENPQFNFSPPATAISEDLEE